MFNNKKKLNLELINAKKIVILTGAGISTLSGLKDFKTLARENDINLENKINIKNFNKNIENFYKDYLQIFPTGAINSAEPNFIHHWIANLEKLNKDVVVITQNIDGLHQKAGSKKIIELHGSSNKFVCLNCKKEYTALDADILNYKCKYCNYYLKPDVVLYGEKIKDYEIAIMELRDADLFLVLGTSLNVYPASNLVNEFQQFKNYELYYNEKSWKKLAIWNKDETPFDNEFNIIINENFDEEFFK